MQRYLDHDLNGEEEQELLLHLQQCDECAGLFDKLRRLDRELAQLPKVVPAISLVDAILPQLAELDRLPAALEETAAQEPPLVAASGSIPRTRRSFFSWRLAGGTAVAAALIGLFVMKEQNLLPQPSSLASNHSASTAGGAVADRAKFSAAATGGAPPASQESASAGSAASNSAAAAPKHAAPAGAADQAAPAVKAQAPNAAAADSAPATKPEQVQRDTTASESNRVQISSPAGSSSEASNAAGTAVHNNAPMMLGASPQPEQKAGSSSPAADSATAAGSATGTAPSAEGGTGQPGLAASQAKSATSPDPVPEARPFAALIAPPAPAPVTMQSPDGKWIAAVENVKVVVRQADTGVTVRTSTYSWKTMDVITLTGFTADGKLSYRVQHPSGADDVVLDMATGVETKTAVPPATK
jgi:hypothetical protein